MTPRATTRPTVGGLRAGLALAAVLAALAVSAPVAPAPPQAVPAAERGPTPDGANPPNPNPPGTPGTPNPPGMPGTPNPPGTPGGDAGRWAAPTGRPPHRKIIRLVPHQFAAISNLKSMAGSGRRTILLHRDQVTLYIGAQPRWTGYFQQPTTRTRLRSLASVARLLRSSPYPGWLSQVEPGVYLLRAAMTQAPGSGLDVSSPRVRELRMLARAQVYLTGVSAQARFHRTLVTSWLPGGGPDSTPDTRRPFVAYQGAGSVLTVTQSQFSYLGGDIKLGYGAVWGRGSTGAALDSVFDHCFFGAYTNNAVDVEFRRSVFRNNDVYGLDPHTTSRGLIVDNNEAYGNQSHGIIFSQDVAESVITNNESHHNGVNGIMVDLSDDNLIAGNRSWNNVGDGIVVQHSARVTVRDNVVTGNRVGVRVTGRSGQSRIERNDVTGNPRGIEIYRMRGAPVAIVGNRIAGGADRDGVTLADAGGLARIVGNRVLGFRHGIMITGNTREVLVRRNRVAPHQRGILVDRGTSGVALVGNAVNGPRRSGLVLAGSRTTSSGDAVSDTRRGVEIRGPAVAVRDLRVARVEVGIALAGDAATVVGADVTARKVGIAVARAARLELRGSRLRAEQPLDGTPPGISDGNILSDVAPPISWLAVVGVGFLMVAFALHIGQRRGAPVCHSRIDAPPAGVRNAG